MAKEEKQIFSKVVVIIGIILLINMGLFFYRGKSPSGGLTGLSVKEMVTEVYKTTPFTLKIFLGAQWILLILLLIFAFREDRKVKSRKKELEGIDLKKMTPKQGTDLDTLYNILKNKKQLRISTISKVFNINDKIAIEWCKILESGNLAILDYPGIGEPIVKLIEK